jgi:hypothetical protein
VRADKSSEASSFERTVVRAAITRIGRDYGLSGIMADRLCDVADGGSYKEIAVAHGISVNTVKTEVASRLLKNRLLNEDCLQNRPFPHTNRVSNRALECSPGSFSAAC